jgi:SulP family sulfate permease
LKDQVPLADSLFPSALRGGRENGATLSPTERLFPFVRTLRLYQSRYARGDLMAALTVALFTIPQGMAYALIAGFPPAAGITTSVVASILGAAFGSSEFLINGPTNAISVMLAGNAALFAAHGDPVAAIVLLTLCIGVAQLAAGLLRIGTLTRFVSEPVLTGFSAGAGVYIVINQLPSALGIEKAQVAGDLWGWTPTKGALFDLLRLARSLDAVHLNSLALAALTFFLVRALQRLEPRLGRRLPATFIAVVLVSVLASLAGWADPSSPAHVKIVRDIEPLTRALPELRLPNISLAALRTLAPAAFAIGLMGAIEAIAIGKLLAAKAGHSFDASRQLIGEGVCNLGSALVGGFASSGSFSRTAVNFEAGAVTRVSCILSGVLVLVIVLAFAPLANLIPIAALAGTLIHVGLKLVDLARIQSMFATTTGDRTVLLLTFTAVLLTEHLENALFLGIAFSIYHALRRAEGFKLRVMTEHADGSLSEAASDEPSASSEVCLLNLQGELYFAAAEELQAELRRQLDENTRFLVVRVQESYNMDATTAEAIAQVAQEARARGGQLILCGVRAGMYGTFERAGLLAKFGENAIFRAEPELLASTRKALAHAHALAAARTTARVSPELSSSTPYLR